MGAGNKVDPDRLDYINPLDITQGGTNAITAADARTNLGLGTAATENTPIAVASGGTGSTTAANARTALGAAASGANSDITSITALSTALSIAQGGTSSTTAAAARTSLGAAASGANQDITSLVESGSTISVNPVLKRLLSGGSNNLDWANKFLSNGWFSNSGDFSVGTVGFGFNVKEGTNARQGVATLVAGTIVVSTTKVLTNSRIFLTINNPNAGTPSFVYVSARTNATSFTITSGLATDTSDVAWEIFNPSA